MLVRALTPMTAVSPVTRRPPLLDSERHVMGYLDTA